MNTFKESVIIPYAMFKSCNFSETPSDSENYNLKRQNQLMQERMYNKKPYSVLTSFVPHSNKPSVEDISKNNIISSNIPISTIKNEIVVSQRPYAQSILEKLLENRVTWDDTGEINIKGTVLKGSNIFHIMKYFTKTKLYKIEPSGLDEVWDFLQAINVPKSWFRNKPEKYRKDSIKDNPLFPSKYPLEESESERISDTIKKSMLDSTDEGDKLDYAGAISDSESVNSQSEKGGIDFGEIEEKLPLLPESRDIFDIKKESPIPYRGGYKSKKSKTISPSYRERTTKSKEEEKKSGKEKKSSKEAKSRYGRTIKRTMKWESLNL